MLEKRVETISDDRWKKIIEDFRKLHENEERIELQLELEEAQKQVKEAHKAKEEARQATQEARKAQEDARKAEEDKRIIIQNYEKMEYDFVCFNASHFYDSWNHGQLYAERSWK